MTTKILRRRPKGKWKKRLKISEFMKIEPEKRLDVLEYHLYLLIEELESNRFEDDIEFSKAYFVSIKAIKELTESIVKLHSLRINYQQNGDMDSEDIDEIDRVLIPIARNVADTQLLITAPIENKSSDKNTKDGDDGAS